MFQRIEQLHFFSTKHNLKAAPENFFFMLLKVNFLGQEVVCFTIKLIRSKIAAIQKIPSPTGKVALKSFIGALDFHKKFTEKLHVNPNCFHNLLNENIPWNWTSEHELFFQNKIFT